MIDKKIKTISEKIFNDHDELFKKLAESEKMDKERKIVSKKVVPKMFGDIGTKISFFKKWFYYKPSWWWMDFSYWLKRKWQQLTTGFEHHESFDYFHWNAKMAVPRLKMLRDNLHGCPSEFAPEGKSVEEGVEEWTEILNKIIWAFENIDNEPMPKKPDDYDPRQTVTEYDDGSVSYKAFDDRKWDWSEAKEHARKVQEGLDLYGKYYLNLWD